MEGIKLRDGHTSVQTDFNTGETSLTVELRMTGKPDSILSLFQAMDAMPFGVDTIVLLVNALGTSSSVPSGEDEHRWP